MASEYAVAIDGHVPRVRPGRRLVQVNLAGGDPNYAFNHGAWIRHLPRQLDDLEQDWLRLIEALFVIDRACKRGHDEDGWPRDIQTVIPVRSPGTWRPFLTRIQEIFGDLTSDRLSIQLRRQSSIRSFPRQTGPELPDADSLALLSGGVDSFVGGMQLVSSGRRIAFLSHAAGGRVSRAQRDIAAHLQAAGEARFLAFRMGPRTGVPPFPREREESERSRTFLYLGVGILIARICAIPEVLINENGILAVHAPMAEARLGSFSTKTAAPGILRQIESLAQHALGVDVSIRNELLTRTKPEIVDEANQQGFAESLLETVSCWSMARRPNHCGVCIPCIVRRVSFEWAGVPDVPYDYDMFDSESLRSVHAVDNVAHFLTYANDLASLKEFELEMAYPEILEDSNELSAFESLRMHRRWGEQIAQVIAAH